MSRRLAAAGCVAALFTAVWELGLWAAGPMPLPLVLAGLASPASVALLMRVFARVLSGHPAVTPVPQPARRQLEHVGEAHRVRHG